MPRTVFAAGQPGACASQRKRSQDGRLSDELGAYARVRLSPGETIVGRSCGGGGYGPPHERRLPELPSTSGRLDLAPRRPRRLRGARRRRRHRRYECNHVATSRLPGVRLDLRAPLKAIPVGLGYTRARVSPLIQTVTRTNRLSSSNSKKYAEPAALLDRAVSEHSGELLLRGGFTCDLVGDNVRQSVLHALVGAKKRSIRDPRPSIANCKAPSAEPTWAEPSRRVV